MRKRHFLSLSKIAIGTGIGFGLFWLTSHPKSKLHRKLPVKKIKQLHIMPNIKIEGKEKTYHFHHWMLLIILYLPFMMKKRFRKSKMLNGIVLGGVLQGLRYKDRFQFSYPTKKEK
ncbi:MAG: hypothetical protein ACREGI_01335 [Candidatus Levyibacteriota bacterium]